MPRYRIYYLKESQRRHFRHAPPAAGPVKLKMKDYEAGGDIVAAGPYAAWKQMRDEQNERRPIAVGDALESENGALLVCEYVGFEEAQWSLPEAPQPASPGPETRPEP
jgi:hypothetical protein